jgi:hypothetical protein
MVASRCNAINDRDSRFISKVLGRQEGSTGHADRYPEVGLSEVKCQMQTAAELPLR